MMLGRKKKKKTIPGLLLCAGFKTMRSAQSVRRQSMVLQLQPVCVQKQDTVTQRDPLAENVGQKEQPEARFSQPRTRELP